MTPSAVRVHDSWERRIARATELAATYEPARPLLETYGRILALQRDCYRALQRHDDRLSGFFERDVELVRPYARPFLSVAAAGDASIADAALLDWWRAPTGDNFVAKAVLQPYAQRLAERSLTPRDRERPDGENVCPFCGGLPQLSILHSPGELEGGSRALLCATCFTAWPFRRVRCPSCGEEDEYRLAYFHAPELDHLRVDACDTCHRYVKSVDLTRAGLAVPLVDEVAGSALDVWARERGYQKIELNLVGL